MTNIKLFGPSKKQDLENEMNTFLESIDSWYVNDIHFNVQRNYLPETTLSEFQELWYGSISYGVPDEEN